MHSETNAREDEDPHGHGQLASDAGSDPNNDRETLVLLLEVNYQGEYAAQTIEYARWSQLTVGDIRQQLAAAYSLPGGLPTEPGGASSTWLVWKGRKLRDPELAKDLGRARPVHS